MRVNRNEFSSSQPVLKPADLGGATVAVLDCTHVEEREFEDGKRLQLTFSQFPDHVYYLNVTSIDRIIEALGDDTDEWETRIPLKIEKTKHVKTGKPIDSLWIAPANEWDDLLAGRRPGGRSSRTPARASSRGKAKAKKARR